MPSNIDVKALEKLAKLCHKYGINHIKSDGLELSLDLYKGPQKPLSKGRPSTVEEALSNEADFTEEDIMFWSSGPTESPVE